MKERTCGIQVAGPRFLGEKPPGYYEPPRKAADVVYVTLTILYVTPRKADTIRD